MVIIAKILRKSGKNQEKKERHDVYLLIMLRHSLDGLCTFPNSVINVNILKKSAKNAETNVDHCQQCWCVVDMVCGHFLIW